MCRIQCTALSFCTVFIDQFYGISAEIELLLVLMARDLHSLQYLKTGSRNARYDAMNWKEMIET